MWLDFWFATMRVVFWTWIWPAEIGKIELIVTCRSQSWENSTGFTWSLMSLSLMRNDLAVILRLYLSSKLDWDFYTVSITKLPLRKLDLWSFPQSVWSVCRGQDTKWLLLFLTRKSWKMVDALLWQCGSPSLNILYTINVQLPQHRRYSLYSRYA